MATKAQCAWNKIALLAVLDAAHRFNPAPVTNVAIQKLLFLTELEGRKENVKAAYYRFYRFKHGPFSTELSWNIAEFETGGFIDSESGELLDRGKYLLDYVSPELNKSDLAGTVAGVIDRVSERWKTYRGWSIVKEVYKLQVPVDGLGGQVVMVEDIPQKIDILVPDRSHERDFEPFSKNLIDDLEEELQIPARALDPSSEEFHEAVTTAYRRALAV